MTSLIDDEIINEFVAESREHLTAIEPDLLAMEKGGNDLSPEVINRVFRAIHSIKGAAGFLALDSMKDLSHAMESVLMRVRDGKLSVTGELMDPLFAGIDCLKLMVDDIAGSGGIPIGEQLRALSAILEAGGAPQAALRGTAKEEVFDLDAEAVQSALGRGLTLFHVSAFLHQDIHKKWSSPLAFLSKALLVGECLDAFLNVSDIGGLEQCLDQDVAVTLLFATPLNAALVSRELQIPVERVTKLETPAAAAPPAPVEPARPAAPVMAAIVPEPKAEGEAPPIAAGRQAKEAPAETLRIRVELLTHLMNLAGELVLGRNQLMRALARQAADSGLSAILQNINQVTTDLQEGIMQTRMQPADTIFNRFPRIIRDMSKQLGKQIEIEIQGSEVEIDKSLVELLGDPLTHIIRNSADHAIETPEERRQAGKDPTGRVLIRAWHQGGHVNISIRDDGRGIDTARLRQKAVAKGLLTEARAAQMTEREVVNLIFAPGLSTKETVSELSGRGVGMDVVRSNTEKMGGAVEVETELGKGTTILLRLPLTLAIIPSMIVGVGDQRFAIPQAQVVEFVAVRTADVELRIQRIHDAEVLRLRDRLLPLVRLAAVLGIPGAKPGDASQEERAAASGDYNIVVLRAGSNQFGVVVDELFDIEEIVVKPLSEYAQNCKSLSGTTILGDGRVILILDIGGLAAEAGLRFADLKAEEKRRLEMEKRRADAAASRRRAIVLCEGAGGEYFAIPQDSIQRLEKVSCSAIQRAGEREYMDYGGHTLPLIRLNDYMEVRAVAANLDEVFLVIPKCVEQGRVVPARAGIVIANIIDALDVDVELEPTRIKGPGILGSAILQNKLTLFLQPMEILRAAGLMENGQL